MSNKIGRFEIQAEISRSSAGSVSKACDSTGGQIVALKTVDLKPFGDRAPAVVKRVLEEAESSKLLNTHNIAMLFGAGEIEGQFCATMEYVQGNSIETMLARKEVFSIWDVQDIARQSCQGFDHARVNKVLHYSLEPAKVMVQWDGIVKTLGFGVSMMGVFAAEICQETPKILHYMSPEQIQGLPIDASSNLFSLGAILYEMVTQIKAFDGDDAEHVRQAVLEIMPAPPCDINPKIDPALSDVIMKALSKAPGDRYQSGQELINDLERCKNSPVKSAPDNKTVQAVVALKTPQIKIPQSSARVQPAPQVEKKVAAGPAVAARAIATSLLQPIPNPKGMASGAAAGARTASPVSTTPSPLKAAKGDGSPQFIGTGIKDPIGAVAQAEPKMSTAITEPMVEAPKIKIDPVMDESHKETGAASRSFSEIDELPPLKEVYVAPPRPPAPAEEELVEQPKLSAFSNSDPEKASQPAREIAKKAVTEIQRTPPKMFAYSIGVAIVIILAIGAIIMFRIRSDNSDDETPSTATAPASSGAVNTQAASANANSGSSSAASQSAVQLPVAPEPEKAENPLSVKAKGAAKKKIKPVVAGPVAPIVVPAQLTVNSSPAGAQIQIDGHSEPDWITPYNVPGLTPGRHTVSISKAGFTPEIRMMDAVSGGKSTLAVHLEQLPATVVFASAPGGASIVIDGKDTGHVTPSQIPFDKPGTHVFLIKKQGYLEETTTTTLAPGQIFHYSPTLILLGNTDQIKTVGKLKKFFGSGDQSMTGTVSVKILPKGAQIAVNSRLVEKTSPVDFYLNPGTYVVDITLSGYKSVRHIVTVNQGAKIELNDILEPQ
jgi:serine/threonine protein kinase